MKYLIDKTHFKPGYFVYNMVEADKGGLQYRYVSAVEKQYN